MSELPNQTITTSAAAQVEDGGDKSVAARVPNTLRFWGAILSLGTLAFICAIDVSVLIIAFPTVVEAIGGARDYVWILNCFSVTLSVCQPLYGQVSDIIGRRNPVLFATALFMIGSGVAGGSVNPAMLIAGRTIQGIGAAGLYVLTDIICCDLVPLRERGKYVGLLGAFAGVAAAIGPVLGGVIADGDWRWIFYMNIPLAGLALFLTFFFIRVKAGSEEAVNRGFRGKLARVDWVGNALFLLSMVSLLYGLISGGMTDPWDSWRVILPMVLGGLGWIAFHVQQHWFAPNPTIPTRILGNRTSATALALTFLINLVCQSMYYFVPVYFQAVKGTTVLQSGIYCLPMAIGTLSFAVVAGVLLSVFGRYRRLHVVMCVTLAISFGLYTLLDRDSPAVMYVFFQLIASVGCGIPQSALLPAMMAALPDSDVAAITGTYGFIRTFGYIWGTVIPAIIFNGGVNSNLHRISVPEIRAQMENGGAYAFASQVRGLRQEGIYSEEVWDEVTDVYLRSMKIFWYIGVGISVACLFAVGLERRLELRTENDTEYGLEADKPKRDEASSSEGVKLVAVDDTKGDSKSSGGGA